MLKIFLILLSLAASLALAELENNGVDPTLRGKNYAMDNNSSSSSSSSDSFLPHEVPQKAKLQYVLPDQGFYPFNFGLGNAGLNGDTQFIITVTTQTVFYVTDCLCNGDSFALIVNGVMVNAPDYYQVNGSCLGEASCGEYSKDPAYCLYSGAWCSKAIMLEAGSYQIDVRIITSPYLGGTGYVMAQTWCEGDVPCCQLDQSCNLGIAQSCQ